MQTGTQVRIDSLSDRCRPLALKFIELANKSLPAPYAGSYTIEVGEGRRDESYQVGLWTIGRVFNKATRTWLVDESKTVTNALPSKSKHCSGDAFDVFLRKNSDGSAHWPEDPSLWLGMAVIAESLGLKSGARWKKPDWDHFEI